MPITTRAAKGSALTHVELDANFTELAAAITFLLPADTAYSAVVPLTGTLYMPQTSVAGAIAFSVAAAPAKGANTYLRLVANGTNTPTFTGMREWGGSSGFDNRNGIVNEIQFFNDGVDSWYSISQEVNAQALPAAATAISMTGPTTGVTGVASTAFSVGVTPLGGAITGTVVVTPSDAAAGGTFTPTSVSLTTAAPSATFTYTPASTGAKTISVTNNGGLTNPANITYTASAAATAPAQVTGLTLGSATTTTQPLSWTSPANGGSSITDYVVQRSPAGAGTWTTFADGTSTATSATVTGLTASTSYDYRVAAVNAVGTGTNSATATGSTAAAATAPGAPTIGTATGGDTSASVTFTAPASNGGSAITGYTVTSSPGGLTATGAASPLTVTGLTNGTAYTFSVTAINAIGTSVASAASNSVTPAAVGGVVALRANMATARGSISESGNSTTGWVYTQTGGALYDNSFVLADTPKMPVGAWFAVTYTNTSLDGGMFGFATTSAPGAFNTIQLNGLLPYSTMSSGFNKLTNGALGGGSQGYTNTVNGRIIRFTRTSDTLVTAETSIDGGTTFTTPVTWTVASGAVLYAHFYASAHSAGTRIGPIFGEGMVA